MGKVISCDSANTQSEYRKILILKPSSLGDIIHTLPATEALHRCHPEAEISWVVNTEWMPLLEGIPYLSQLIPFPRKDLRGRRNFLKARAWMSENIKDLQPDLTLDFQGLLRSGLMAREAKGLRTVGFRNAREGAHFFYDTKVKIPNWKHLHAIDRNLELVYACGVPKVESETVVTLPAGEYLSVKGLPERDDFVLLHPFSRGIGKSLSKVEVAEFCEKLHPRPVVIVGAGVEWDQGNDPPLPDKAHHLLNQTSLAQLIDLIRRASFTVSVDSGPMHLAAAITKHLLSIHTWSDPMMVGPWRKNAFIWRDGGIWQVDEIETGQFPENRDSRENVAAQERIINEEEMTALCEFVANRIDFR